MAESKNTLNAYVCPMLHATVTIHKDEGTTPMFIGCRTCGKQATSRMGMVDSSLKPTHEWYKPTPEDIDREVSDAWMEIESDTPLSRDDIRRGFEDHARKGGLYLRRII